MPWRFQECWDRIDRANAHREALGESWNDVTKEDFYGSGVSVNDDGTGSIWTSPVHDSFPPIFALQLGEIIYQLRAALDACVYRAAVIDSRSNPPPNEKNLEFPICCTRKCFKNSASKIRPLKPKRRSIIKAVQPYNTPADLAPEELVFDHRRSLGVLHDWARIDRHRKLHVLASWGSNFSPKLRYPPGTRLAYMKVKHSGFLEDENEVASFRLIGYRPGMKIQANPDLMIDVAVKEIPRPCADNDTLGNRIVSMIDAVKSVVHSFEKSF